MYSDGVAANTKSTKEGPELLIVDTFGFYTNPVEWVSRCELSRSQKSSLNHCRRGWNTGLSRITKMNYLSLYKAFVVFSHVVWPHRQSCFTAHHLEGSRPSMVSSQPQADQWFGDVRSISLVKSGSFGQLRSMHTLARFWSLLLLYNPGSSGCSLEKHFLGNLVIPEIL